MLRILRHFSLPFVPLPSPSEKKWIKEKIMAYFHKNHTKIQSSKFSEHFLSGLFPLHSIITPIPNPYPWSLCQDCQNYLIGYKRHFDSDTFKWNYLCKHHLFTKISPRNTGITVLQKLTITSKGSFSLNMAAEPPSSSSG